MSGHLSGLFLLVPKIRAPFSRAQRSFFNKENAMGKA
jgi:hypothetical protein